MKPPWASVRLLPQGPMMTLTVQEPRTIEMFFALNMKTEHRHLDIISAT